MNLRSSPTRLKLLTVLVTLVVCPCLVSVADSRAEDNPCNERRVELPSQSLPKEIAMWEAEVQYRQRELRLLTKSWLQPPVSPTAAQFAADLRQQVIELDGSHFDVFTTEDDIFWFDVTELIAAAGRSSLSEAGKRRSIARPV